MARSLGQYIPFYLNDNNMSVTEFSKMMNVSRQTVNNWINGKEIRNIKRIVLEELLKDYIKE